MSGINACVVHRVKGRAALTRRLRALLVAVHRFGRARATTPDDLQWTAHLLDTLTAALDAADPGSGVQCSTTPPDAPVTHQAKRYVFVCLGCDGLADAERKDQITCSPACRSRVHRAPEQRQRLAAIAEQWEITIAGILQAAALDRLRPDLGEAVLAGRLTMAAIRGDVWTAYMAARTAALRARA